jgi:hypothetical protein
MKSFQRRRLAGLALAAFVAFVVVACEDENVIEVQNTVTEQVRIYVRVPGGGVDSVSPSVGESSEIVAPETGTFYAFGMLDTEWLANVRNTRDYLTNQVNANLRTLSTDQIHEMYQQINYMNDQIRHYEESPLSAVGGCSAEVTNTGGKVQIEINPAGGFPTYLLICSAGPPKSDTSNGE